MRVNLRLRDELFGKNERVIRDHAVRLDAWVLSVWGEDKLST